MADAAMEPRAEGAAVAPPGAAAERRDALTDLKEVRKRLRADLKKATVEIQRQAGMRCEGFLFSKTPPQTTC